MKTLKPGLALPLLAALSLSACSGTGADYTPITDGTRNASFDNDLKACQDVARQQPWLNDQTREDALIGAGIGVMAGMADSDVSNLEGAVGGAVAGGLAGAGASTLDTRDDRKEIVISCMRGRGHSVVG